MRPYFKAEQRKKKKKSWDEEAMGGWSLGKEIKFGFEYSVWYNYWTRKMGTWKDSNPYFRRDLNENLSKLQKFIWRGKLSGLTFILIQWEIDICRLFLVF